MNDIATTGAEAPAADVAAPVVAEAPVVTSEATTEQPTTETVAKPAEQETGDDAAAQPKKKHWAHERIDELTRQRREAERQAEYWRQKATSTSPDYDGLEYEDQIAERVQQRTRQEQAETAQEAATRLAQETFSLREASVREKFPDYDVVARNPSLPITNSMAQVILDSDAGPEIAYHLGKNPAEAAKIAAMPSHMQAAELGKLEVRLSAPKPVAKTPAAPIKPVSGMASSGSVDPATMSMAEYVAWRNAGNG